MDNLQNLCDKLTSLRCQNHLLPMERICIEVNCTHPKRGMCRKCPRTGTNHIQEVNINNLFDYLKDQQQQTNKSVYYQQASLLQQFVRNRTLILELLDQLQIQFESLIYSISDKIYDYLNQWGYLKKSIDISDAETLGELFSRTINVMDNDEFTMTAEDDIDKHQQLTQLTDWFNGISNDLFKKCQDKLQVKELNQANDYKLSQIIQLDNQCSWVCFNHCETSIVAAVSQKLIIFNLSKYGQWIQDEQQLTGHAGIILSVKFNHNSTQIASCGQDQMINIWNKQQNGLWIFQKTLIQHTNVVNSICYNHNSTILASGSDDKQIHIYAVYNQYWHLKQQLTEHRGQVYDVCFNNNSTLLASGSGDYSIILWECDKVGQWIAKQKLYQHTQGVFRVFFNSNASQLLSGSFDKSIKVSSLNDQVWKCDHTLTGHTAPVRSVSFNQQSNIIASSSNDKSIKIWRISKQNTWECTQTINENTSQVYCATLSSDSSMIISGSQDNKILIHKLQINSSP